MDAQTLLSRVGETLSVRRVFGEPIERNGIVVIPVAFVAGGGGGGDGPIARATSEAQTETNNDESMSDPTVGANPLMGSGGGIGGVVVPLGVYVVKGDGVQWKPVLQPMLIAMPVLGLIRLLVKGRSRALRTGAM